MPYMLLKISECTFDHCFHLSHSLTSCCGFVSLFFVSLFFRVGFPLSHACMSLVRSEISIALLGHLSTHFKLTKIIILRDSQHS
jgi:hypothetical protein